MHLCGPWRGWPPACLPSGVILRVRASRHGSSGAKPRPVGSGKHRDSFSLKLARASAVIMRSVSGANQKEMPLMIAFSDRRPWRRRVAPELLRGRDNQTRIAGQATSQACAIRLRSDGRSRSRASGGEHKNEASAQIEEGSKRRGLLSGRISRAAA